MSARTGVSRTGRVDREGAERRPGVRGVAGAACTLLLLATTGCDNIAKRIPWFTAMMDRPGVETYEEPPAPPPEGTVPVEGDDPDYTVAVADTIAALRNPLSGTEEEIARGEELYTSFCLPCHGTEGRGQGPVVNHDGRHPGRLPFIPTLDLTAGTGPERSDGYIWGMIENGRPPLMPDYERIPSEDRWYIVEYVRELQRRGGTESASAAGAPASSAPASSGTMAARGDRLPGGGIR